MIQPTQLDPGAINLTKAIRQTESGGNFQAMGKSGEYGAYQFTKPTWDSAAKKYGVVADYNKATPEQQNEVAYKQIKEWKDQGYNVGQIASLWNSGKPDAYLDASYTGTNKYGATFDVPAYAKSVATAYQTIKGGGNVGIDPNNPSSVQQPEGKSIGGFIGNIFSSAGNLASGLGSALIHPVQTVKNLVETGAGGVEKLFGDNNEETQKFDNVVGYFKNRYGGDSLSQIVHNIGNTIYNDPTGVALDLSTLLDGVGSVVGAAGKVGDVAKAADLAKAADFISTAKGLIAGGTPEAAKALEVPGTLSKIGSGLKTAGEAVNPLVPVATAIGGVANKLSEITDTLPRRIVNNLLPQLKTEALKDYAIENLKVGKVDTMLETSSKALDSYDTQIKAILGHPDYSGVGVEGGKIIESTLSQFPNSEYTPESIYAKVKSQIPGSARLVTKLENGTLTLEEANTLRQAIDRVTYKSVIDSPEIKAGKELASSFGNALRSEVKTLAPETVPIFDGYSKEINLQKALQKLALKTAKKGAVSVKELLAALTVKGVFGPIAGLGTFVGEKITETPGFRVGTAKAIKSLSEIAGKTAETTNKIAPLIKEATIASKISKISK